MHLETTSTQTGLITLPPNDHLLKRLMKALIIGGTLVGLAVGYYFSGTPITLVINEKAYPIHAHQLGVDQILRQIGWALKPEDTIWPPLDGELSPGQQIKINLARPVVVDIGQSGHRQPRTIYTLKQTPLEIYRELGIELKEVDEVYVNEALWPHTQSLPLKLPSLPARTTNLRVRPESLRPEPVRLVLNQAIPIHIHDGDRNTTFWTTSQTVGDVLVARNIPLYLGDAIFPPLSEPLASDLTIAIERAIPVTIQVDNALIKTRTRQDRVGRVLAQEGIALIGQDYTIPVETTLIKAETNIDVVRVVEALEIEKETTDFETVWVPDQTLELDIQQVQQEGHEGVTKTRTRVRYENGEEVFRAEEDTWLEQTAENKIVAYGTKVVIRTLTTSSGEIEYWRKIRMLATSYSAATSGKSKDNPTYGITRTGLPAGYGIAAVDPGVVELGSNLYVPGYGQAIAGDTGSSILGKHIDLGFDEDLPPLWYKWVDVYLLTPIPPQSEIRYVLPQWPQER